MTNLNTEEQKNPIWRRTLASFIGPTATTTEIILQFLPPLLFSLYITIISKHSGIRKLVSSLLAFDLLGGVLTNSTTSAKLWYHRPGRTTSHHLRFVALHVLHICIVALLFRHGDSFFAVSASLYLLIAASVVLAVQEYLRRPVAMGLYCGAVMLDCYVWRPSSGVEWFVPLFFLKLLVAHLLPG